MKVDKQLVDKLADLAKLEFDEASKASFIEEFQKMIGFVDKLNEVDTEGVEPLIFVSDEKNVLRKDEVIQEITTEQALLNAPHKDDKYIKVPKVINRLSNE